MSAVSGRTILRGKAAVPREWLADPNTIVVSASRPVLVYVDLARELLLAGKRIHIVGMGNASIKALQVTAAVKKTLQLKYNERVDSIPYPMKAAELNVIPNTRNGSDGFELPSEFEDKRKSRVLSASRKLNGTWYAYRVGDLNAGSLTTIDRLVDVLSVTLVRGSSR